MRPTRSTPTCSSARCATRARRDGGRGQLREIADYNAYDCISTLGLRDWLLDRAESTASGAVLPAPRPTAKTPSSTKPRGPRAKRCWPASRDRGTTPARRSRPRSHSPQPRSSTTGARTSRSGGSTSTARSRPSTPGPDQKDVLIVDAGARGRLHGWARNGTPQVRQPDPPPRRHARAGQLAEARRRCFVMYDVPHPWAATQCPTGSGASTAAGEILEVASCRTAVRLASTRAPAGTKPGRLRAVGRAPIALTPRPPFSTKTQREAILEWGEALADVPIGRTPTLDLLRRAAAAPPRRRSADAGDGETPTPSSRPASASTAPTSRCRALPDPARPTSARTSSRSSSVSTGGGSASSRSPTRWSRTCSTESWPPECRRERVAKRPASRRAGAWTPLADKGVPPLRAAAPRRGYVLGGTAWDFSNRNAGAARRARPARHRRSRPVLAREHDRRRAERPEPAAARRPAAAAAGEPGPAPGARRHFGARLALRRPRRAARRLRLLPR